MSCPPTFFQPRFPFAIVFRTGLALAGGLLLAACGDSGPVLVNELHSETVPAEAAPPAQSNAQRLLPMGPMSRSEDGGMMVRLQPPPPPAGWQSIPPRSNFYLISYDIPGGVRCDVSITGGTVESNLIRWVGQFPEGSLPAGGLEGLPEQSLATLPGQFLELAGDYNPGMGRPAQPGTRMLGTAASDGQGNVIAVKMTGPDALVARQKEAFLKFCEGLQPAA